MPKPEPNAPGFLQNLQEKCEFIFRAAGTYLGFSQQAPSLHLLRPDGGGDWRSGGLGLDEDMHSNKNENKSSSSPQTVGYLHVLRLVQRRGWKRDVFPIRLSVRMR